MPNILLIKVLTLEIRLINLLLTLASSREPADPNAGSMGVLPHPTAREIGRRRKRGPTPREKTVFREDGDGIDQKDGNYGKMISGWFKNKRLEECNRTIEELAEAKEQHLELVFTSEGKGDTLLAILIPLSILLYLVLAPYTKVEESFNIQATHDILTYGLPIKQAGSKLRAQYDHHTFTGPVPRTFVGPLALAAVSWPGSLLLEGVNKQILVRATLGIFNAFCLLSFRNGVRKLWGRTAANCFVVFQAGQFHLMYYASRTLPNFFAFGLTTLALRDLLPISSPSSTNRRYKRALTILTATGVVFRSEIALLVATHTLYLLAFKRHYITLYEITTCGLFGLLIGLSLTVPIDSYFWFRFPLWSELSAFRYNILSGQASNWGTSPPHFYLTSALPRLLFNPFIYQICLPFTISLPTLRPQVRDILIPNLAFVALYSFQPHKEWRFIIYIIPTLSAVASAGAAWIWNRRAKSLVYRVLALCFVASSLGAFGASLIMLAVSRSNYPGAEALDHLHRLHLREDFSKGTVRVHMDTLTCMTGVTRFLHIPAPSPHGLSGRDASADVMYGVSGSDTSAEVMWIYDKSEDATQLLDPGFWEQFDYALAERVETVIGKWEVVGTVDGYAGVAVVKPGDAMIKSTDDDSSRWQRSWERFEHWGRWVTRGWWLRPRSEPTIRILRKQRAGLEV
ncbi:dolichyl-P-Man:Man(7)GlcNAc(2)-PP-dolichol alpha-1,6-mannosyltransferase [Pseudocyphellaria aurata]|nr:dolichyl-P-Man:Man(7)GlcNAc(2)-PP-dolichol alpha-1,6-mannosyltransferase [Pseudocyphellaria aurata]